MPDQTHLPVKIVLTIALTLGGCAAYGPEEMQRRDAEARSAEAAQNAQEERRRAGFDAMTPEQRQQYLQQQAELSRLRYQQAREAFELYQRMNPDPIEVR